MKTLKSIRGKWKLFLSRYEVGNVSDELGFPHVNDKAARKFLQYLSFKFEDCYLKNPFIVQILKKTMIEVGNAPNIQIFEREQGITGNLLELICCFWNNKVKTPQSSNLQESVLLLDCLIFSKQIKTYTFKK